jgi:hypothetical protein
VRVAIGLKSHSGWAVSVVIGFAADRFHLLDRRRVELVDANDTPWAKAPYHAADGLPPDEARALVERAVRAAERGSEQALRELAQTIRSAGHDIVACAVLTGSPMPEWTTEQILAVHVRMHKAEGALFPAALMRAAGVLGLPPVSIPQKELPANADKASDDRMPTLMTEMAGLGKSVGPPWGIDQKNAALAAMIAVEGV